MKFKELYDLQDSVTKERLNELYKHKSSASAFGSATRWSFDSIPTVFSSLTSKAQLSYISAVSSLYRLSDDEISEALGDLKEELISKGFFLVLKKGSDFWYSPEEIVTAVLGSDHPVVRLFDISKATLSDGIGGGLSAKSKEEIIRLIVRQEHPELTKWIVPSTTEISKLMQDLLPLFPYISGEKRYALDLDMSAIAKLKLVLDRPGYYADYTSIKDALVRSFSGLFDQAVVVFAIESTLHNREQLRLGPAYERIFRKFMKDSAEQKIASALKDLQPPVVSSSQVLRHIPPSEVLRRCVIATAWRYTDRLEVTQQGTLKVADLRKLTRLLVGKRWAEFEEGRIYYGTNILASMFYEVRTGKSPLSFIEFLSEIKTSDFIALLLKSHSYPHALNVLQDTTSSLPRDRWIAFKEIENIDNLRSLYWETGVSSQTLYGYLNFCAFVLGDVDSSVDKDNEPFAVRLLGEKDDQDIQFDNELVVMQPSGEIVVPDDLKLPILFELAKFFSLTSANTFAVDAEMLRREAASGSSAAEVIAKIAVLIGREAPELVKRLVRDTLGQTKNAFVGLHECFVCVEDDESASVVKNALVGKIQKNFGDRCFVLVPGNYRTLTSKLQKLGVRVDDGSSRRLLG